MKTSLLASPLALRLHALLGALATVSACAITPADAVDASEDELARAATAQMNDVSVLFPLAKTQADLTAYLSPDDPGVGGAVLPAALLENGAGIAAHAPSGPLPPGASPQITYDVLRAVAFRIDPCFANVGPITQATACENQLRIVFEAFPGGAAAGAPSALDGAVHAFYALTRAELVDVVREIVALRRANGGSKDLGALAVHPIIAKQGLDGAMATGLNAILRAHAGASNLVRFTIFQGSNLNTVWNFSTFDVADGQATKQPIPTLPGAATNETFFVGFGPMAGQFTPAPQPTDDLALLTNVAAAHAATDAARKSAYDAALRIENPGFDSPNTVDCASCHMAEPARVLVAEPTYGLRSAGNANAFVADPKFVSAKDFATSTPLTNANGLDLHAFSYKGTEARINRRTVNETAAVVAYLNGHVL